MTAAMRSGQEITTTKKFAAATNKQRTTDKRTDKIEAEDEDFSLNHVSLSVGKTVQQARNSLGLTQKDLATKINEKPQVIADVESGKALTNQQVLGRLERLLGVKLRGKDVGQPLHKKKSMVTGAKVSDTSTKTNTTPNTARLPTAPLTHHDVTVVSIGITSITTPCVSDEIVGQFD